MYWLAVLGAMEVIVKLVIVDTKTTKRFLAGSILAVSIASLGMIRSFLKKPS